MAGEIEEKVEALVGSLVIPRGTRESGGGGIRRMGQDRLGFDLIFISDEFRLGANSSLRSKSGSRKIG